MSMKNVLIDTLRSMNEENSVAAMQVMGGMAMQHMQEYMEAPGKENLLLLTPAVALCAAVQDAGSANSLKSFMTTAIDAFDQLMTPPSEAGEGDNGENDEEEEVKSDANV